ENVYLPPSSLKIASFFPVCRSVSSTTAPEMPLSASSRTRPETVLGISCFFFASPLSVQRKICKAESARRHTSPRAARRRAVTPGTRSASDKTEIPRRPEAAERSPLGARASSVPVIFVFFLLLENIQLQGIRADDLEFSAAFRAVQRLAFLELFVFPVDRRLACWTVWHRAPLK